MTRVTPAWAATASSVNSRQGTVASNSRAAPMTAWRVAAEGAMRRRGSTTDQTGVTAYSVAHDLAASHLRRGLTVIADAVNPVPAARLGWRDLARSVQARHVVIETSCPGRARLDRIARREPDVLVPLAADAYEPRTDDHLVVDTTRPLHAYRADVARYAGLVA